MGVLRVKLVCGLLTFVLLVAALKVLLCYGQHKVPRNGWHGRAHDDTLCYCFYRGFKWFHLANGDKNKTNKNLRCGNRKGLLGRNDQTHHRMGPKTMESIPPSKRNTQADIQLRTRQTNHQQETDGCIQIKHNDNGNGACHLLCTCCCVGSKERLGSVHFTNGIEAKGEVLRSNNGLQTSQQSCHRISDPRFSALVGMALHAHAERINGQAAGFLVRFYLAGTDAKVYASFCECCHHPHCIQCMPRNIELLKQLVWPP